MYKKCTKNGVHVTNYECLKVVQNTIEMKAGEYGLRILSKLACNERATYSITTAEKFHLKKVEGEA